VQLLRIGVIIDVHRFMEHMQVAAGALVLRKTSPRDVSVGQTSRRRIPDVLDGAHRLARDVTLLKIMKDGREYGVAVVGASQGVDVFPRRRAGRGGHEGRVPVQLPQEPQGRRFSATYVGQDDSAPSESLAVRPAHTQHRNTEATRSSWRLTSCTAFNIRW
jgi:hypothetical protein